MDKFHRGLIIVKPYGTYIKNRTKTLIVKTKNIKPITNTNLLLIEEKLGLGIIVLGSSDKINLSEFKKLSNKHLITDEDRLKWWPKYKNLYSYPIIRAKFFRRPILLDYTTGPQITIKPSNIHIKRISIGMSGYYYRWMYPDGTKDYLGYYSKYLNSVEINSTFYRLPSKSSLNKLTNYDLTYTFKVSQYITHSKKLKNVRGAWTEFYKHFEFIHDQIACFLFQFSPSFVYNSKNLARLEKLSTIIPATHRYAFEFRHSSWFNNSDINDLFKDNDWMLVIVNVHNSNNWAGDLDNGFNPQLKNYELTSDSIYIRMHGTSGKYVGSYDNNDYREIFNFIKKKSINNAFVYFNNTDSSHAFDNSIDLLNKFNILNRA